MNIVCATTSNPWVMTAAIVFLGFSKMTAFLELLIVWYRSGAKKWISTRVYPFVYAVALAGNILYHLVHEPRSLYPELAQCLPGGGNGFRVVRSAGAGTC